MADDVKVTFTGNSADAEKAIAQLERKYDALEQKIKRLGKVSKESADQGKTALDRMGDGAAKLASSLTGIGSPIDAISVAIAQIGREWDAVIQRQDRAKREAMDYAAVLENLAINTRGDASFPTLEAVDNRVKAIANRTGVAPKDVAGSLSYAMSAKANLSGEDAAKSVESVLSIIPNLKEAQNVMVGAVLDVRKSFPQASDADVQGFMFQAMQTSRVVETEKFAKNAMPAILGGAKVDESKDLRANSAIYNTLTQFGEDVEGRRSRTAAIALNMQLKEFLKDEPGLDSNMKRVEFMQQNPAARQAFLYGGEFKGRNRGQQMTVTGPDGEEYSVGGNRASFERQVFPAVEQLLTGGSKAAQSMKDAYQFTPELVGAGSVYQSMLQELKANKTINLADNNRKLMNAAAGASLNDTTGAMTSAYRGGLGEIMQANRFSAMSRTLAGYEYDVRTAFGQDPNAAAQGAVGNRTSRALAGLASPFAAFGNLVDWLGGANVEGAKSSVGSAGNGDAVGILKNIEKNTRGKPARAQAVENN